MNPTVQEILANVLGIPIYGMSRITTWGTAFRNRALSYNWGYDYDDEFGYPIEGMENSGTHITRTHNPDPQTNYLVGMNVPWNDNDSTMVPMVDSSLFRNRNSILTKTKALFRNKKIDTIVSRFHTEGNVDTQHKGKAGMAIGNAATERFGMSHGRNLLTREAEEGGNPKTNGYENPYCRVWTNHHQYDTIAKQIRPFSDNGSPIPIGTLQKDWTFIRGENGAKRLNDNSVLNKNGFVNIAPSYSSDPQYKIPTKKCMFSIENLAWKGVSNYDFRNALSWEQRGPLGGRIMWFPPYDISFNENINVNWNSDSFIGRGEKVFTYIDTDRTGNLHFKMVVDHPSIINYYEGRSPIGAPSATTLSSQLPDSLSEYNRNMRSNSLQQVSSEISAYNRQNNIGSPNENANVSRTAPKGRMDTDLLRFFAGCDTIEGRAKQLTDEYAQVTSTTVTTGTTEQETTQQEPAPVTTPEVPESEESFVFYVYYPNNYSGVDDPPGSTVEAMAYLLNGAVCQKDANGNDSMIKCENLTNHLSDDHMGSGFEMSTTEGVSHLYTEGGKFGTINGRYMNWQYRVDEVTRDERLLRKENEIDMDASESGSRNGLNIDPSLGDNADYSFAEVAYAIMNNDIISQKASSVSGFQERVDKLKEIFGNYTITEVTSDGYANSHGNNASTSVNDDRNNRLAQCRAQTVISWLKQYPPFKSMDNDKLKVGVIDTEHITVRSVSDIEAKKKRCAKVTVKYTSVSTTPVSETQQEPAQGNNGASNFQENKVVSTDGRTGTNYQGYHNDKQNNKNTAYKKNTNGETVPDDSNPINNDLGGVTVTLVNQEQETNNIRYDQEYHFFEVLKDKAPHVFQKFTERIKYFTPAFHSMTPEGFTGRVNFLNQCTRQGNTVGAADASQMTATNLAFGRPPICVLRLGDFYYTKIVITSVQIDYDPLVWDLNSEGIGVQPLIADVNISFTFIGGSDIAGPIARLQNAMTFNYYANMSIFDNRADQVEYSGEGNIGSYTAYNAPLSPSTDI